MAASTRARCRTNKTFAPNAANKVRGSKAQMMLAIFALMTTPHCSEPAAGRLSGAQKFSAASGCKAGRDGYSGPSCAGGSRDRLQWWHRLCPEAGGGKKHWRRARAKHMGPEARRRGARLGQLTQASLKPYARAKPCATWLGCRLGQLTSQQPSMAARRHMPTRRKQPSPTDVVPSAGRRRTAFHLRVQIC